MKNGLEINAIGSERYYKDGVYHREDGPAVDLTNGYQAWYIDGKLHRVEGPAIINNRYLKLKAFI